MPPDQTKNHRVLHVFHPTKPYQEHRHPVLAMRIPLVCLVWSPHPLPVPTNGPFWLCAIIRQYYQSLPSAELNTHTMITSILLYLLIVAGLAYAAYLKADINRWK
jgi:hypothetical protein